MPPRCKAQEEVRISFLWYNGTRIKYTPISRTAIPENEYIICHMNSCRCLKAKSPATLSSCHPITYPDASVYRRN